MKRVVVVALALAIALAANACRRIVDLTPLRDSGNGDAGINSTPDGSALGDAFTVNDDAGVPGDIGSD
jgi:hypothetical protein